MNMSSLFGLSTPVDIDIHFNGQEQRKQIEAKVDKDRREKFPLYFDGETVAGKVTESQLFYDRGNHYEFRTIQQELAVPGELRSSTNFDFEFKNIEKQYESYHGINVKL
ncbi:hypothetical protein CPC16_004496, partial [Podila verticillata]